MRTQGMFSMLATITVAVIFTSINSIASTASAQQANSQHKYNDDAIVRDLKAGKLTVREAQMLQQQNRAQATAKSAVPKEAPKPSSKAAHAGKPVKNGKATKATKATSATKPKGKAPVKHLTAPHHADKQHAQKAHPSKAKPHSAKNVKPHHAAVAHAKAVKAVQPVKPVKKHDKAATAKTEPVRKTAVKYIR